MPTISWLHLVCCGMRGAMVSLVVMEDFVAIGNLQVSRVQMLEFDEHLLDVLGHG